MATVAPAALSTTARFCAATPLTEENEPPMATPAGVSARAFTVPSVLGFHVPTAPVDVMCASVTLPLVSTLRKSPPMYQPPLPSGIAARTMPSTRGEADSFPSVGVTRTPYPVVRPR